MKLFRSVGATGWPQSGCALTIGNFDAVHIGHQQIIRSLCAEAKSRGLPVAVMTFDPHPEEYFVGKSSGARLTNIASRFFALQQCGVDLMLSLPFNESLAHTAAEDFVRGTLVEALGAKYVLVGDDFRFGRGRAGNFAMLRSMAMQHGFMVMETPTIEHLGRRVSSSYIKELLLQGDLDTAEILLGRRYTLCGRVIRGQQLGRQWGFPTLNLAVRHKPALTGVFAVKVSGIEDQALSGVANLGKRPTVDGLRTLLEVNLFDFDRSVYGHRVCVEFISKIRDEKKFDSFVQLKGQIMKDAEIARSLLYATPSTGRA